MTIQTPVTATASRLYKYSSLASAEHLERLRVVLQEHELYLPNLVQLNDPSDGRPRLTRLSEEKMGSFLYEKFLQRNPNLAPAVQQREDFIIRFNVRKHGTDRLQEILTECLNAEL